MRQQLIVLVALGAGFGVLLVRFGEMLAGRRGVRLRRFMVAFGVMLGGLAVMLGGLAVMRRCLYRRNKKARRLKRGQRAASSIA